jgi:hypothetical protein
LMWDSYSYTRFSSFTVFKRIYWLWRRHPLCSGGTYHGRDRDHKSQSDQSLLSLWISRSRNNVFSHFFSNEGHNWSCTDLSTSIHYSFRSHIQI